MAAPRRALNSALLRIVAQPAIRSTCKASTFLHAAPRSQIERLAAATTTQRATSLRWYSSNDHQHEELITGSKRWEAEEIRKQIEINKQLKASGEEKTESGEGQVIFVDVREPEELHTTGRIPGAINIPIVTAMQSFHISDEDFRDLYGFDRPPKDAQLMFYCKAGVRAKTAAGLAQHAGWTNIGEYPGSWIDWEARLGPVQYYKGVKKDY